MAPIPPRDLVNAVIEISPMRTDESVHSWRIADGHGRWIASGVHGGTHDATADVATKALNLLRTINRLDELNNEA